MKLKILLISFILSLLFWLSVNVLADNLEVFVFQREIIKNPQLLAAQINPGIIEEKLENLLLERKKREYLKNLEINAKAAISVEVDNDGSEKIIFEKNSEESLPIASLTKLMTALVVFNLDEIYNPSQKITITEEAVSQDGQSRAGDLKIGETLSIKDLLYIMLIESDNDTAFALTEPVGQKGFVGLMNLYARDLELNDTYFINSTGLEPDYPQGPKNHSSARDLARLAFYILKKYPKIFEITNHRFYEVLDPDDYSLRFVVENTNILLSEIPEIIGGKTGWTPGAGDCLLLVLKNPSKDNSYFINVVLGADNRFKEMRELIDAVFHTSSF